MRTSERDELLKALTDLSRRYPHWRFGQLIANVAGWADAEVWDAADTDLLAAARAQIEAIKGREPQPQRE